MQQLFKILTVFQYGKLSIYHHENIDVSVI